MSLAVCIRCGNLKRGPAARCAGCGLRPSSDDERAKSLLLSLDAEIDGEPIGPTREQLLRISADFARSPPVFDVALVQRVIGHARQVGAITPRRLLVDLVRWIGVPLLVLTAVLLLIRFAK